MTNRDSAHRAHGDHSSTTEDHDNTRWSNENDLDKQDLKGNNNRNEPQDTGLEEGQGGEQSPDIGVRRLDAIDRDGGMSSDPSNGQLSNTGELCKEQGASTDESNGVYLEGAGGPESLCNPHSWHTGEGTN